MAAAIDYRSGADSPAQVLPKEAREDAAARQNWLAYCRARDAGHRDYVELARKCDAYYRGEQWDEAVISELNSQNRPHLTVNMVLSTINGVAGQHIMTRQDIAFLPRGRGANEATAKALTAVINQIQYNNKSQWNEQQVFSDGLIEDRGYFDIRIDFTDNIYGEVRETVLDPRDVLLDPEARDYDPSTWKQVIISRWYTPDEIEVFFGKEKADKVRNGYYGSTYGSDSVQFELPDTYGDASQPIAFVPDTYDEASKVSRIRVIERQHKQLFRARFFVDLIEGDMRRVPDAWDDARAEMFADKHDLAIVVKPELRIRWTISADCYLLYDDWSLYNRFTVIPYFPYFRRGRPFGLVRNLISPQDMLNKITSQELHVVNTTANSGWIFETGTLVNMDADDLAKVGAKTGLVLEYTKGATPPQKIEPNQVPSGLDNISMKAQLFFRTVSGLPDGFFGHSNREVSGVALDEQRQAGVAQLEVPFDNLAKTRQLRAEFMLELIQQFYTEQRLIHVTRLDDDGNHQIETLTVNELTPEGQIINDLTLGEYSVVVASVPHHETIQDSIFAQLIEMRNAGVTIPDWVVIENSRLDNKREVADLVKRMQGAAEPTQEEIERNLRLQELELAGLEADVRGKIAKAMESEANARLLLAKAGTEAQAPLVEAQKLGAELRADLERLAAEIQSKREELQARIIIAREKNQGQRYDTNVNAMVKRLQAAADRETKLKQIAAARGRSPNERKDNKASTRR